MNCPRERNNLLGKSLLGWKAEVFSVASPPGCFAAPAGLPVWKQPLCFELVFRKGQDFFGVCKADEEQ